MKFLLSITASALIATLSFAQSTDEKVGAMMNAGQWFELREFMETGSDSIHPFLDLYGKAMIAHFFNRPEQAVKYCSDLLGSPHIALSNVASVGLLMCSDISKLGDNTGAAQSLESIDAAIKPYYSHLDSSIVAAISTDIAKYKALSAYKVNTLKPFGAKAIVSFTLVPVGTDSTKQEAMNLTGRINGRGCDMTFDTGAGVNVISDSLAAAMQLDILDVDLTARGIGLQSAKLAIAKELTIGELTIYNVPFFVMTILSGHHEADKYMSHFQIVVGKNIMESMKYFTIDFEDKTITVTSESGIPASVSPNLCLSSTNNYRLRCYTADGTPVILNPDTGDTSYGVLNSNMLPLIQSRYSLELAPENIRMAGAGGVLESRYYYVKKIPLSIGGVMVTIPEMPLLTSSSADHFEYDGRLGLATFMLFRSVLFDLPSMKMQPII